VASTLYKQFIIIWRIFMRKLILDQYSHQSLLKRFLGNTLTGLGWGFWIFLWLPLFDTITILLSSPSEQPASAASNSIMVLLATLTTHASVLVILIAAFFAWSMLQWLGKLYRHDALHKQQVNGPHVASPSVHTSQDVQSWQQAQSMVVSHDDASGYIHQVEILKPKSKVAQRKHLPTYLRTVPPNPKRQFDALARWVHR
jgi:poly-beta-1,6-N-acetyl-D-glucosamine biosynthesis protein PgaD